MPELTRPDSEALLKNIQRERAEFSGKLKIFFGYAPGVGKTYAMLEAAHRARAAPLFMILPPYSKVPKNRGTPVSRSTMP